MSASPAPVPPPTALELIRDGLRMIADGVHLWSVQLASPPAPGPRLVAREAEAELITQAEAAAILRVDNTRSVRRFVKRHPQVVRHVGARVLYDKSALVAATKKR